MPDATLALLGRGVDLICQIPGNLTAASFSGIADAAKRRRVPVFAFQNAQAQEGAQVVLGRNYQEAGVATAAIAARIMRGEKPAGIAFDPLSNTTLIVNLGAARAIGLALPPALLKRAERTIKE